MSKKKASKALPVKVTKVPEKKQRGRPSLYSVQLVDKICDKIATSEKGLHAICSEMTEKVSVASIMKWLQDPEKEYFTQKYARAKELQAEYMAEQIMKIADDSSGDNLITDFGVVENREFVNRSRLRVDTRKWLMSKLLPKKYGDKLDVTSGGNPLTQTIITQDAVTGDEIKKIEG